jgi:uroporphyrinogen-III decarboxylase
MKPNTTDDVQQNLTMEEKREKRFQAFCNPQGVTFVSAEAEAAYQRRAKRQVDFFSVRESDRVPVAFNFGSIPAYEMGTNYKTVSYDFEKAAQVWEAFNEKYAARLGTFVMPFITPSRVLDLIDYKLYNWPGHGLDNDAKGYQFVDGEYMKADEYDVFLRDPSGFFLKTYLPRTFGVFGPMKMLRSLTINVEVAMLDYGPFGTPEMQQALETLIEAGKEQARFIQFFTHLARQGSSQGYPLFPIGFCKAPFDVLGDTLRGSKGIMMDMFRQPDVLLEAMDRVADIYIAETIQNANQRNALAVTFPLHMGADGWMNEKQFTTFYWPPLKKVVDALINEGLVIILFAEGGYNTRLELVNDFPKGAVSWMFDQTDMQRAKKILGANCSISGNIPTSLLSTGTPQKIKECAKNLIEICAPGGGYMLRPGASVDEAKMENLIAMFDAAKEYGMY